MEEHEAWDRLLAFGCDLAQGYLLSRPLPAYVFDQWLAETDATGCLTLPLRNVPMPAGALT